MERWSSGNDACLSRKRTWVQFPYAPPRRKMSNKKLTDKLLAFNTDKQQSAIVRLTEITSVLHYTGDYTQDAYDKTGFLYGVVNFITQKNIRKSNSILDEMRYNGSLDDYERGSLKFIEYVYDKLKEAREDYFSETLEAWDHKRGNLTLNCDIEVPINLLMDAEENGFIFGDNCTIFVPTEAGTLEVSK